MNVKTLCTSFSASGQLQKKQISIGGNDLFLLDKRNLFVKLVSEGGNAEELLALSENDALGGADILLDDATRSYISMDAKNQYIIIGRNPTGLLLSTDKIFELTSEKTDGVTKFSLTKAM